VAAAARVLVVDDDALMLASVSRKLSRQGYDVLPASRPRQALEIIKTPPPVQLILSDVSMPEMRGTQLLSEVFRLAPETADLRGMFKSTTGKTTTVSVVSGRPGRARIAPANGMPGSVSVGT
jgi:CheY-like chemotaxis protein